MDVQTSMAPSRNEVVSTPKTLIDLQKGWPTPRLFPSADLASAATTVLNDPQLASKALVYGPSLGHEPLRTEIASWMSEFYTPEAGPVTTARIGISGGASQNLASILQVFSDPKSTKIWMIEPVYFHACTIFQDAGFGGRLEGVPENDCGVDLVSFRNALELHNKSTKAEYKPSELYSKIYRHILYVTPTFSNPTGRTMSTEERSAILDLAREFDILIVSDDVYDFLRWPSQETSQLLPRFVDLDRKLQSRSVWGNCVSNGSFSKIVAPGIRVGWYEANEAFVSRLAVNGSTSSGGNPSQMSSMFVHQLLLTKAIQRHVQEVLVPTYKQRSKRMRDAFSQHLEPLGLKTNDPWPEGGFFAYVTFPDSWTTPSSVTAKRCLEYGVKIAPGDIFVVKGNLGSMARSRTPGGWGYGARLCWAWHEVDEIEEGIRRFAAALRSLQ